MSIRFTGADQGLSRTANLPSTHTAFTIYGFAKLSTPHPTFNSYICYTQGAVTTTAETVMLKGATGTELLVSDNYESTYSPVVANVTTGQWFFWAMVGTASGAGGLSLYYKPVGSGSLLSTSVTNTPGTEAMAAMLLGDAPSGFPPNTWGPAEWWFDGWVAHLGIYNRALSAIELATQASQAAPASATNLLSYHSFVGTDLTAALAPTQGTGSFSLAQTTAPQISSDNPTFGAGAPTLTGSDTLPSETGPVYTAPTVTTTTLPAGVPGAAYSQELTTTGSEPVSVVLTSGSLPSGLTLVGKTISGTPAVAGTFAFSVTPTGPGGTGPSRALSISIVSQDVAPTFITTSVANGVLGAPYSQVVAASGTGTITRSIVSGSLPPGLTLDGVTGAITGTPTALGSYAFRMQAANGVGSPAFVDLVINIYAVSELVTETSGSTTFSPTITEIMEEAYERAGSEMRSGYNYRTARRSLNLLTIEWASRGINLWTIEQGSIPLQAGVGTYFIPVDTIDLVEHAIRQNPGSSATQTDITISRIALPTYAAIPNKLTTGRPIQIYINRQAGVQTPTGVSTPTVTVWPIPPDNSYTLVYWRLRRIQDAGTGVNIPDIPFRFLPCLVAGLAFYIAMKIPEGQERLVVLQAEYERQWQLASEEDRDKAPVRFVPRTSFFR